MSTVTSVIVNLDASGHVRVGTVRAVDSPMQGVVKVDGLNIVSTDPDALEDLASALSEAASRMRIIQRTEAVA